MIEMTGVRKRFGGVIALDGADFVADRGSVHALLGPNGSGKSTLLKVLTGVVRPDAGTVAVGGRAVRSGPRDAVRAGVATVYQELSLADDLSVAENVVLGTEPVRRWGFLDRGEAVRRARTVLEPFAGTFGGTVPATDLVATLEPAERQVVEICKALAREPAVLVLDEATASLRQAQVEILLEVVKDLAEAGTCVIFTSHRLTEIQRVCERATILRSGRTITTVPLPDTAEGELVRLMVGELASQEITRTPVPQGSRMEVTDLSADEVHGVSFTASGGEVLGIGGLQGQGQSALLATLFGARRASGGKVTVDDREITAHSPAQAIANGFAYVPGNRGTEGLALRRPILENLSLPTASARAVLRLGLSRRREVARARESADRVGAKYGSLDDPAASLSGGNQQKIVFAKWLAAEPVVVLMDDPLKGVDVRAKAELLGLIRDLAAGGAVVILSSSDDRELLEVCDRVLVMFEGRVSDELSGARLTDDGLLASALGVNSCG